ncbi:MAG: hypothetical protein ABI884_02920 [Gemmatimonadota bacterium]
MVQMIDRHLSDFALAELVDATKKKVGHFAIRAHLEQCWHCQTTLAELREIVRDPRLHNELGWDSEKDGSDRRRILQKQQRVVLLSAFAAAVVLVLAMPVPVLRGPAPETKMRSVWGMFTPVPPQPDDSSQRVTTLIWTRLAHADRYHVTVYDSAGAVAWAGESGDTNISLPRDLTQRLAGRIRWRVTVGTSGDGLAETPPAPHVPAGVR